MPAFAGMTTSCAQMPAFAGPSFRRTPESRRSTWLDAGFRRHDDFLCPDAGFRPAVIPAYAGIQTLHMAGCRLSPA